MTGEDLARSIRRLYWLMASFGTVGFVWYLWLLGPRTAVAFLLGVGSSFGNLWLFSWLSASIAPGDEPRKPWQAGLFIARYLVLFTAGYVIVKALNVNVLAVVFGLFASTAAILVLGIIEIFQNFLGKRRGD